MLIILSAYMCVQPKKNCVGVKDQTELGVPSGCQGEWTRKWGPGASHLS